MNNFFYFMLVLLTISGINTQAQTGVFYYTTPNQNNSQSRMVDLLETKNENLVLLNTLSDENYANPTIQYIAVASTGALLFNKVLPVENLYDITGIEAYQEKTCKVFGNLTLNKQFQPFQVALNEKGEMGKIEKESSVFSTLTSNVALINGYYYILYTKDGKNERYNISLHKIEAQSNKVVWLKKISSEQNEEADKIVVSNDGYIFILGKKYNDEVTNYLPVIYKLDANGDQVWKKGIDVPNSFNNQSFFVNGAGQIIYMCSYTKNPTGFSETRLIRLSELGEELSYNAVNDFSANGMLALKNQQILLYGSKFYVDQKQVLTKGGFVILSPALNELTSKILDATDKPDADLNLGWQTSSDFNAALELSDGRMALGGKVFMPTQNSKKHNIPLLMLINADGSYQK